MLIRAVFSTSARHVIVRFIKRQGSGHPAAPEVVISAEPPPCMEENEPEAPSHESGSAVSIRINGFPELEAAAGHWQKAQTLTTRLASIIGRPREAVGLAAYSEIVRQA